MEGQATLSSYLLFSPPLQPGRDVYSWATSAGWQATCLLLERMPGSPQGARKAGHIPSDWPLPLLRWSCGFLHPPVTLALFPASFEPTEGGTLPTWRFQPLLSPTQI